MQSSLWGNIILVIAKSEVKASKDVFFYGYLAQSRPNKTHLGPSISKKYSTKYQRKMANRELKDNLITKRCINIL